MKHDECFEQITKYLNLIKSEIELYNGFKLYNINKFSEYFYAEFLNLLFEEYHLEIMEKINPNMVAIDLGDKNREIAVQVTSDTSRDKIKHTVEEFKKNNLHQKYKRLIVLHIANKTPNYQNKHEKIEGIFDLERDVWNITYLLKNMPIENINKLEKICYFLKKYVGESPNTSNLSKLLQNRYTKNTFTEIKLLSSNGKTTNIQDIYQELLIKKDKNNQNEQEEHITLEHLLDSSNKVMILGKSGVGKSTLSKYICYKWSKKELFNKYEYLFYIPIKKWDKGEGVFDVVFKVLKESLNELLKIEASTLYEYIQLHKDKTLFIIDGFDEISNEVSREDIFKEIQNFDNYICTSRSEGIKQNEIRLYDVFENEGFGNKSIEKYINTITNTKLSKYLMSNDKLKDLSKNPLLLDIICLLYKENRIDLNKHFTMTSLYEMSLDELIYRFEDERKKQSNKIESEEDYIFRELGKIAFENLKNSQFKFKGTFIKHSNRRFIENELLLFGFLSSLTKEKHLKDRKYEFIHRSFQEYFAAYYVNTLSQDEQREIIKEYKFYPHLHLQMFFSFLAGLLKEDNKQEWFLKQLESKPIDLIGHYAFHLQLQCIKEVQNVSDERKKKIFDSFWARLEVLSRKKLMYERADELSYLTHLIDDDFREKVFDKIENDENYNVQKYLASSLAYLGKNDDTFVDKLIELGVNRSFNHICGEVLYSLKLLSSLGDELISKLFQVLDNINIDLYWRLSLVRFLIQQYKLESFSDKLLAMLQDAGYKVFENINLNGNVYWQKIENQADILKKVNSQLEKEPNKGWIIQKMAEPGVLMTSQENNNFYFHTLKPENTIFDINANFNGYLISSDIAVRMEIVSLFQF